MKKVLLCVVAGIMALSLAACGSKTASVEQEEFTGEVKGALEGETLSVGTSGTYAPFSYYDTDGTTLIGFDLDFLAELQDLLGFKIDSGVQAMDYSPLTTSLSEGKLDIAMAALCATDTRKKNMNFTDTYYNAGLTLIVNSETSPAEITGFDSIKGGDYTVAVQKGDASHLYLTEKGVPTDSIKVYDSSTLELEALEQGKVDAMVYDAPGTAYYIENKVDTKLEMVGEQFAEDQSPYAIAVSFDATKNNPKLVNILNAAITELTENGTMKELEDKWCN